MHLFLFVYYTITDIFFRKILSFGNVTGDTMLDENSFLNRCNMKILLDESKCCWKISSETYFHSFYFPQILKVFKPIKHFIQHTRLAFLTKCWISLLRSYRSNCWKVKKHIKKMNTFWSSIASVDSTQFRNVV